MCDTRDFGCQTGSSWKLDCEHQGHCFVTGTLLSHLNFERLTNFLLMYSNTLCIKEAKLVDSGTFCFKIIPFYVNVILKEDFSYSAIYIGTAEKAEEDFKQFSDDVQFAMLDLQPW
jgi:hypothetical protein